MATRKFTQNNFTQGQVGPYIQGRGDTPIYKAGLETCENFLCLPQGGITKRKGFQFISADPDNSTTPDGVTPLTTNGFSINSRMFPFKFSDEQEYVIVMEPSGDSVAAAKMHIFYNDVRIKTLTDGTAGDTFPIGDDQIDDVRFAQSFDYMILVHPDIRPMELVRGATNTDWTCTYIDFDHVPQANFNFDSTLSPASTSGNNVNFTLAGGTYAWVNAAYPNGHVGMHIDINGGMAVIKSVSSSTVAVCDIIYELVDNETAEGHEWKIDAFSNLSASLGGGWPRSVSFHQNRLIFGGTRDKPQTIFGSQTGDFFNFDNYSKLISGTSTLGEITDSSGLQFTIASDQLNIIRHIVSQQSLFIFTSDGEFDMAGEPVTPSNVLVRQQTRYGVGTGKTLPQVVDNEVLFVQRGGAAVRAFVYNFNTDAYSAKNYNLVHHNILSNATNLAYIKNYDNSNNNFVFALNDDGTLSVLGVNTEYTVVGWTKWTTNGAFKDLIVVDDSLYTLTQRYTADGSTLEAGVFLEKLTEDAVYLDCFHYSTTSSQAFQGAQGLENRTVQAIADGLVHPDVSVDDTGSFILTRVSSDTAVGYNYIATAKTLPVQVASANLTTLGERVRKVSCELQFYQSKYLEIDGFNIPFKEVGGTLLDAPVTPFTGMKRMRLSGYSRSPQVTLINNVGLPITLLSLTTEVKFGLGKLSEAG